MTVSVMLKNNSFNFFDERQTNPRDSLIWKSQMRKSLLGAIFFILGKCSLSEILNEKK